MQSKQHIFIFVTTLSLNNLLNAQNINNIGFESTAPGSYTSANGVTGWTLSSQSVTSCISSTVWASGSSEFSIVSTPVFNIPGIGIVPTSPLGGTNVAKFNDYTAGNNVTRLSQNFQVTNLNTLFQFAMAGVFGSQDACCSAPQFKIIVKDCAGTLIPALTMSIIPASPMCASGNGYFSQANSQSGIISWSNWQIFYIDLSAYIGTCVSIELICSDCTDGYHFGSAFFDAHFGSSTYPNLPGAVINAPNPVNYCSSNSNNTASILAPIGYSSYSWIGPSGPIITSPVSTRTLSINSPVANTVYTVNLTSNSGYTSYITYTIASSSPSMVAISSSPSCSLAANGTATAIATGGDGNYVYSWFNSQGTLLGNAPIISNLAAGIYSVSAYSNCGGSTPIYTIAVGTTIYNSITNILPFCDNQQAYLVTPSVGTNYQWYNNTTLISSNLGGTANEYTVTSPSNGDVYRLSYQTNTGCIDSVSFYLSASPSGTLNVIYNTLICPNANNGSAIFSLTPASNSPSASISFSTWVLPGPASYSISPSFPTGNTFTINNLLANTTYSLNVFDGFCKYSSTLTTNSLPPLNYSFTPVSSTLCPGQTVIAGVGLPYNGPAASYSYSWSPTTFLFGNISNTQITIITPTTSPGTITTIIYTIVVTPTALNCPSTGTISVTMTDLQNQTLSINPIPSFCANSPSFAVVANPPGGIFYNTQTGMTGNIITPSVSSAGVHSFMYSLMPGTCVNTTTGLYTVNPLPQLSITGNTVLCSGKTGTLSVTGADSYTWNNNSYSSTIIINPTINTIYSISGNFTNTNCSNTDSISVIVNPNPIITAIGARTICQGSSTTLTPTGANYYYNWIPFLGTNPIIVSPTVTTSYTLIGTNTNLCSGSEVITISVIQCSTLTTQYEEENTRQLFKIYPNPTKGLFYIELPTACRTTIYDGLGNLIFEESFNVGIQSINFNKYNNGVYLLKCAENNFIKTVKLIKE